MSAKIWKRARLVLAWIVSLYLAQLYVRMGWIKFDPRGFWTVAFEDWGYPAWLRLGVGAVETVGGVALLIPWTATYAAAGLILVMLGAWVTRFHDGHMGDVLWITAYAAALAWIGYEWRHMRWPRRQP